MLAFEPQRVMFDILCNNLRLNGLTNVTAYRRAVGREAGQIHVPTLDYARADNFGGVALGGAQGEAGRDGDPRQSCASTAAPHEG